MRIPIAARSAIPPTRCHQSRMKSLSMPDIRTIAKLRQTENDEKVIYPTCNDNRDDDDDDLDLNMSGIFIDDDDEPTLSTHNTTQQNNTVLPSGPLPMEQTNKAIASLERFFLGSELEEDHPPSKNQKSTTGSPTSTMDFHLPPKSDKNNNNHDEHVFCKLSRTISLPLAPTKSAMKKTSSFSSQQNQNSMKPSVSFSSLSIREYSVSLGDNPSCSYGVPISLGWDFEEQESLPIEVFEQYRESPSDSLLAKSASSSSSASSPNPQQQFRGRRSRQDMILSHADRKQLLKAAGYTSVELRNSIRQVNQIKHERGMTELFLAALPLEHAVEQACDHVKTSMSQLSFWM